MSGQERHQKADILILWAYYGEGHRQASLALAKALGEARPELAVETLDYMEAISPLFSRVTRLSYLETIKVAPFLYGYYYRATGYISTDSFLQQRLNRIGCGKILQVLQKLAPRVVISTYPTSSGAISELKRAGLLDLPLVTVITDHAVHSQWIAPGTDLYLVASQRVRRGLIRRGVPAERIAVTGIPIDPKFNQGLDQGAMREKYGLRPDWPVVLVMSGAYGVLGGVPEICRLLASFDQPVQALVVAGRDLRLRSRVEAIAARASVPMRVFGYVEEVEELMAAADLLITKAGGLTTSEALAMSLPMIIYRPIPGQEEENTRFLVHAGAAVRARNIKELSQHLHRLLTDEGARAEMKQRARAAARPEAAREAARLILDLYGGRAEERDAASSQLSLRSISRRREVESGGAR
ncbi:MAG: glycosyltransferase [Bacillota bacterium]|nr:glycosyltransferase [Bacillota bacterium]